MNYQLKCQKYKSKLLKLKEKINIKIKELKNSKLDKLTEFFLDKVNTLLKKSLKIKIIICGYNQDKIKNLINIINTIKNNNLSIESKTKINQDSLEDFENTYEEYDNVLIFIYKINKNLIYNKRYITEYIVDNFKQDISLIDYFEPDDFLDDIENLNYDESVDFIMNKYYKEIELFIESIEKNQDNIINQIEKLNNEKIILFIK